MLSRCVAIAWLAASTLGAVLAPLHATFCVAFLADHACTMPLRLFESPPRWRLFLNRAGSEEIWPEAVCEGDILRLGAAALSIVRA